ncbi:MAG: FAD-dependent oxidoreductase [Bryobacterales bacterium]|nr:FAD-dependent oxidoreductase [Bryobacterales bacterium]
MVEGVTFSRRAFLALAGGAAWARELAADVAVIGGGFGGCAAALAALRSGLRVVMTEPTAWIGGQATSQAVPPDEHPWIESFGCTRSYRAWRDGIRAYYRQHYPLTPAARERVHLNPGSGTVSRLTHEPKVALAALEAMLAPYASSRQLTVLAGTRPGQADVERDRIRAVTVEGPAGRRQTIAAHYFLDATEQGDLLPLAGAEHITGAEAQSDTGEPHAAPEAQPGNIQAFTVPLAIDYLAGEDHTIDRPEDYGFWREYVPDLAPPWPGRLLDWTSTAPVSREPRTDIFDPVRPSPKRGEVNLFLYRRIADRRHFERHRYASDITLVNWSQNDYWLGPLHGVPDAEAARNLKRARQLTLSLLYWMQTEAPRPDGGTGWPGLRPRPDVTGTGDGLSMAPYIRESRRIRAVFTVKEQHVATALRPSGEAERFSDSVGIGSYRIDLHPTTGGRNYLDISTLPFQIPLGALLPVRVDNLLPAAKNAGVTHITNGCFRLHPVEWNIGEAAGELAAEALAQGVPPRAIRDSGFRQEAFQNRLVAHGVEIAWPRLRAR